MGSSLVETDNGVKRLLKALQNYGIGILPDPPKINQGIMSTFYNACKHNNTYLQTRKKIKFYYIFIF